MVIQYSIYELYKDNKYLPSLLIIYFNIAILYIALYTIAVRAKNTILTILAILCLIVVIVAGMELTEGVLIQGIVVRLTKSNERSVILCHESAE